MVALLAERVMAGPSEDPYRPCHCGSGQKYKFCCLKGDRQRRREILNQLPTTVGPDGRPIVMLDLEEAQRLHDRGMELLESGQARPAMTLFEKLRRLTPMVPQPYNNLALACFLEGDLDKAIAWSEQVDREVEPGNVFALGNLVHFYLMVGRRREAEATAKRMAGLTGRDEFAEVKRCEALSRLRRHEEVSAAAARALPAASDCRADLSYFAGVAAANLARYAEAERFLTLAVDGRAFGTAARRCLKNITSRTAPHTLDGEWPYLHVFHWSPPGLLERFKNDRDLPALPGLVEAMICALNETEGTDTDPLTLLKTIGSPEARAVLRRVLSGTFGTDQLRLHAHQMLVELGELSPAEPVTFWFRGKRTTTTITRQEVGEDAPSGLPEHLRAEMDEIILACRSKDWARAERLGRILFSKAPDVPQVCFNLAVALRAQGKDLAETEELLRRAIELDPSYAAAPSTLAMIRIEQDRLDEARKLLAGVTFAAQVHPTVYLTYLLAQVRVAVADGDFVAAAAAWEWMERLAPDSPHVRDARRAWGPRLLRMLNSLRERRLRCRREQRRRLLSEDPPAAECLEPYTRELLQAMARAMGLPRLAKLRKAASIAEIAGALGDPETVRRLRESAPDRAREALDHVVNAGGVMPFDEFVRRWGDEGDVPPAMGWNPPDNALGCLKHLGLVAEGTVGGRESVVAPREVRQGLRAPAPQSSPASLKL